MKQLSETEAIDLYNNEEWNNWTNEEIALFQLNQQRLCVPFRKFHESVETLLDRPVWTHEFARPADLIAEYEGKVGQPSMGDIYVKLIDLVNR
jgi:hypothetical protein